MKWYRLTHLAAVTMSCFCADLQLLFPKSASGIARALPSHSFYTSLNFRTRYVGWCRFQTTSILFNDVELGRVSSERMGREWLNLGGLVAPRHTQRPPTYRDPFFPRPCQKVTENPTQYSLLQQLPRKTFDR